MSFITTNKISYAIIARLIMYIQPKVTWHLNYKFSQASSNNCDDYIERKDIVLSKKKGINLTGKTIYQLLKALGVATMY